MIVPTHETQTRTLTASECQLQSQTHLARRVGRRECQGSAEFGRGSRHETLVAVRTIQ